MFARFFEKPLAHAGVRGIELSHDAARRTRSEGQPEDRSGGATHRIRPAGDRWTIRSAGATQADQIVGSAAMSGSTSVGSSASGPAGSHLRVRPMVRPWVDRRRPLQCLVGGAFLCLRNPAKHCARGVRRFRGATHSRPSRVRALAWKRCAGRRRGASPRWNGEVAERQPRRARTAAMKRNARPKISQPRF